MEANLAFSWAKDKVNNKDQYMPDLLAKKVCKVFILQ